jgi:hypothetical protein
MKFLVPQRTTPIPLIGHLRGTPERGVNGAGEVAESDALLIYGVGRRACGGLCRGVVA